MERIRGEKVKIGREEKTRKGFFREISLVLFGEGRLSV
jgi:hypothetical protein